MEQREPGRQLGEEGVEDVTVDTGGIAVGDGRDADEGLQGAHHAIGHGVTLVASRGSLGEDLSPPAAVHPVRTPLAPGR